MTEEIEWTAERAYRLYHDRILGYIRAKVSSAAEAEDICSAVFLKVHTKIAEYTPQKSAFSTWIYTIARNAVIDYFRTAHRHEQIDEEIAFAEDDYENILREETLGELASALEKLPQRERDIIILHYYFGKTLKEVAAKMNISYSSIKFIHNRAITILRARLSALN